MKAGWPDAALGEVVERIFDRRGVTPEKLGGAFCDRGHRVISAKHIKQHRIDLAAGDDRFVDTATYRRWMNSPLLRGDVIVTSEAPLGEVAFVDGTYDWCIGQRLFSLRPKQSLLDGRYLFFALRYAAVQEDLRSRATGTTVTGIRQSELVKVRIPLPPISTQQDAARILGALDDKIELNRRMNETLEAMARALFKSWFVDFDPVHAKKAGRQPHGVDAATAALFPADFEPASSGLVPRGWRLEPLDSTAHFLNGLALQKFPALDDDSLPVIKIADMRRGDTSGSDRAARTVPAEYVIKNGDVLFSWSGSLEVMVWAGGPGALNQHIFKVTSTRVPTWFVYGWLREHLTEFRAIAADKATTMGHIQRGHLTKAMTVVPSNDVIRSVGPLLEGLHTRGLLARLEARKLADLRDALLPKLLSGELRIPDAERIVGKAV